MNLNHILSYKKKDRINKKLIQNLYNTISYKQQQRQLKSQQNNKNKSKNFLTSSNTKQHFPSSFNNQQQIHNLNQPYKNRNRNDYDQQQHSQQQNHNRNYHNRKNVKQLSQNIKQKLQIADLNLKQQIDSLVLNSKFHAHNLNMNINIHYNNQTANHKEFKNNKQTRGLSRGNNGQLDSKQIEHSEYDNNHMKEKFALIQEQKISNKFKQSNGQNRKHKLIYGSRRDNFKQVMMNQRSKKNQKFDNFLNDPKQNRRYSEEKQFDQELYSHIPGKQLGMFRKTNNRIQTSQQTNKKSKSFQKKNKISTYQKIYSKKRNPMNTSSNQQDFIFNKEPYSKTLNYRQLTKQNRKKSLQKRLIKGQNIVQKFHYKQTTNQFKHYLKQYEKQKDNITSSLNETILKAQLPVKKNSYKKDNQLFFSQNSTNFVLDSKQITQVYKKANKSRSNNKFGSIADEKRIQNRRYLQNQPQNQIKLQKFSSLQVNSYKNDLINQNKYKSIHIPASKNQKRRILTQQSSQNKRKRIYESIDYIKQGKKVLKNQSNEMKQQKSQKSSSRKFILNTRSINGKQMQQKFNSSKDYQKDSHRYRQLADQDLPKPLFFNANSKQNKNVQQDRKQIIYKNLIIELQSFYNSSKITKLKQFQQKRKQLLNMVQIINCMKIDNYSEDQSFMFHDQSFKFQDKQKDKDFNQVNHHGSFHIETQVCLKLAYQRLNQIESSKASLQKTVMRQINVIQHNMIQIISCWPQEIKQKLFNNKNHNLTNNQYSKHGYEMNLLLIKVKYFFQKLKHNQNLLQQNYINQMFSQQMFQPGRSENTISEINAISQRSLNKKIEQWEELLSKVIEMKIELLLLELASDCKRYEEKEIYLEYIEIIFNFMSYLQQSTCENDFIIGKNDKKVKRNRQKCMFRQKYYCFSMFLLEKFQRLFQFHCVTSSQLIEKKHSNLKIKVMKIDAEKEHKLFDQYIIEIRNIQKNGLDFISLFKQIKQVIITSKFYQQNCQSKDLLNQKISYLEATAIELKQQKPQPQLQNSNNLMNYYKFTFNNILNNKFSHSLPSNINQHSFQLQSQLLIKYKSQLYFNLVETEQLMIQWRQLVAKEENCDVCDWQANKQIKVIEIVESFVQKNGQFISSFQNYKRTVFQQIILSNKAQDSYGKKNITGSNSNSNSKNKGKHQNSNYNQKLQQRPNMRFNNFCNSSATIIFSEFFPTFKQIYSFTSISSIQKHLPYFNKSKNLSLLAYSMYLRQDDQISKTQMLIQQKLSKSKIQKPYIYQLLSLLIVLKLKENNFYQAYHIIERFEYYGVFINENQGKNLGSIQNKLQEKKVISQKKDLKVNKIQPTIYQEIQAQSKNQLNCFRLFCIGVVLIMKRKLQQGVEHLLKVQKILKQWNAIKLNSSPNLKKNFSIQSTISYLPQLQNILNIYLGFGYYCVNKLPQTQTVLMQQQQLFMKMKQNQNSKKRFIYLNCKTIVEYNNLLCKGLIELKKGQYETCIRYLKDALKIFNRPEPHIYIVIAYLRLDKRINYQNIEKQNKIYSQLSQVSQNKDIYIHLCMATNLVHQMNNNFASTIFYLRALYYCLKSKWQMALNDIDEAIQKSQQNYSKYFYLRGLILACNQNYKQSISQISVAISLNQKDFDCYLLRSKCCQIQGDQNQAFLDLQTYITLKPEDNQIHKYAGHLLFQNGAFQDAILAYQQGQSHLDNMELQNLDESDFHVFLTRSKTYFLLGEFNKAASDMKIVHQMKKKQKQYKFDYEMISFLYQLIVLFDKLKIRQKQTLVQKAQEKNQQQNFTEEDFIRQSSAMLQQLQTIYCSFNSQIPQWTNKQPKKPVLSSSQCGKIFKKVQYHLFKFLLYFYSNKFEQSQKQILECIQQKQKRIKKNKSGANSSNQPGEDNQIYQQYQQQQTEKQLFLSQMYFNLTLIYVKMKNYQKAKKALLKCKIDEQSKNYGIWKSFLMHLSSKELPFIGGTQQQPQFNEKNSNLSFNLYSDKNKLSKFFTQVTIQFKSPKGQIFYQRLKPCIPYPKVQPPDITPVFDIKLLESFNQDQIQKKPQAPWIVNQKNSIKFTQQIKTFSRLDIDNSQCQSQQPKKQFLKNKNSQSKFKNGSNSEQGSNDNQDYKDETDSIIEQSRKIIKKQMQMRKRSSRLSHKHQVRNQKQYDLNNSVFEQDDGSIVESSQKSFDYNNLKKLLKLDDSLENKLNKFIKK